MNNLYQPMSQQNSVFYNNKNTPNPANLTASNQVQQTYGNYQTSFNPLPSIPFNGYDPKSIFNNNNFVNRNDILHNNLHSIILNEEIREYSILIDSKDRNYQIYPDPFCYEVRFGPLPKSREKVGNKTIVYEDPNPVINENFVNVRYIKLEDVLLPFFDKIKCEAKKCDGELIETWKVDTCRRLTENLYIVLSIGDTYIDTNYRSTNDVLSDSFATIYYDHHVNDTHFKGYTRNGIKVFPPDQLAKIDKLRISFMDPYGNPLTIEHVNKQIKSAMLCTCDNPDGDSETTCFKHNLFHPLNPIFQHHLHFKVGVVEPRLNKMTFS